jgi:hypothetical protein
MREQWTSDATPLLEYRRNKKKWILTQIIKVPLIGHSGSKFWKIFGLLAPGHDKRQG